MAGPLASTMYSRPLLVFFTSGRLEFHGAYLNQAERAMVGAAALAGAAVIVGADVAAAGAAGAPEQAANANATEIPTRQRSIRP